MDHDSKFDVIGIGNAIVDVLSHADDAFLDRLGLAKGAMTLIDAEQADRLYSEMKSSIECSGGSAANSMVGLSSLGGNAAYIGKIRDDGLGGVFANDIRKSGVAFDTKPAEEGAGTGRCMVLVTPDAQRTMQTFLGVSAELSPTDVDPVSVQSASITYLEGYLWDPPAAKEAFLKAARVAHDAGRKVALSLSDSFCVDRHRAEFRDLVENHVDILFANEDEIVALYESSGFDDAVRQLRGQCDIAALTRGAAGSVVVAGDAMHSVDAAPVDKVVDTTGAGDLFASGFLFGLTHGYDPAASARIGGIAAAEVISHFGARPEASLQELIRRHVG